MHHILHVAPRYDVSSAPEVTVYPNQDTTVHTLYYPYDSRYLTTSVDLVSFYEDALEYVKHNNITGVFSGKDLGSLISAMIAEHFHFPGPSVESVFLTLHKQLTKKVTHSPLSSELWDSTTPFPTREFPYYLKAPYSSLGSLGFLIHSQKDLDVALPKIMKMLPEMNKPFFSLLGKTNIPAKYPEALQNAMAVEPLVQAPQVTVEGFVQAGVFHPTIITDTNFLGESNLFDNFSTPSRFSQEIQEKIIAQAQADITQIGLQTTFFNAEYWILPTEIILIEVNARAVLSFSYLYELAWGYKLFENMIALSRGEQPQIPAQAHQVAGQFNIFTKNLQHPEKLQQLATEIPQFRIFVDYTKPIKAVGDHGAVAAQFELAGNTYAEIFEKAKNYRSTVQTP
jgi:hypothetical protein